MTHKAPPIICSRLQFQILPLFQKNKLGMIFHENRLQADDSHEISYLIFVEKLRKMSLKLLSAAFVMPWDPSQS